MLDVDSYECFCGNELFMVTFVFRNISPFDPESNQLGPELIPDLAEREKKADFLEDMFQQKKEETEEDEYNREQDVYGQEEVYKSHFLNYSQ